MVVNSDRPLDRERFNATVKHYDARVDYAPEMIDQAVAAAQVGPDSTVLDLGCGPGNISNVIAEFAGHVIGVDPSEGIIEAARENAPSNVSYVVGSSEDLSFVDRPLALVTFGRSFHWMDREATLATLDGLVEPNGCIALLNEGPIKGPVNAWWRAMNGTIRKFAEPVENARSSSSHDWERHEVPLVKSAFSEVTYGGVLKWDSWSFERIMSLVLSRSNSSES